MKLIVYIDFGMPSWLLIRSLLTLVEETGVDLEWRAFTASLGNIANSNVKAGEDDPLAAYKARRARARRHAGDRERARQREMLKLDPAAANPEFNPAVPAVALDWIAATVPDKVPAFLAMLFDHLYREQGSADAAAIEPLLKTVGCPLDGFGQHLAGNRVNSDEYQAGLVEEGILGAPTLLLDEEIFLGREHLPLIRWIIDGRQGTPPV